MALLIRVFSSRNLHFAQQETAANNGRSAQAEQHI
jgi:hypothetical protein